MDLYGKNIKILIDDRNYNGWIFLDTENNNKELDLEQYPILKAVNPVELKLFSRDIINIGSDGKISVWHSHVKTTKSLAGVLMLEDNKTMGRTANGKRLLYKCVPDDRRLPIFVVPYELKIGFSKVYKNKFVTFNYDDWTGRHPTGIIAETLGDVDNLEVFYEYQLYCKSIHESIANFTNKTRSILNKKTHDEYIQQIFKNPDFGIQDRRDKYVFTIDPSNSLDYDDGFGIETLENGNTKLSVYIANVFFWIETLGLWNSFSRRVATIYLPDRRRPMLPTILSDTLCSLQQNQLRFSLVMDFEFDDAGKLVGEPTYSNVLISVAKNYVYEDPYMVEQDVHYRRVFDFTSSLSRQVKNSHDVVSFWMVKMNRTTGEFMAKNKFGIFRSATYLNTHLRIDEETDYGLNENTIRVIQAWNNTIGQYVLYKDGISLEHGLMSLASYIHVTSPIRRLVDLLNQMLLFGHLSLVRNVIEDARLFVEKWTKEMDYVNTAMRSIRRVQTDCELMNRCFNMPDIMTTEHSGVMFDRILKNDGTTHYMVYLEDLKLLSRISTHSDLPNYSIAKFKLLLFDDEDKAKKKIRLQMI